jgi:hypothetical protein
MDQERRTDFDRFPSFGAVSSGLLPILPFEIPSPFPVGPAGGVVIWLTVRVAHDTTGIQRMARFRLLKIR